MNPVSLKDFCHHKVICISSEYSLHAACLKQANNTDVTHTSSHGNVKLPVHLFNVPLVQTQMQLCLSN